MKKIKNLLFLFWVFFKVGLFTFGGGYAMISVLENELIEKRKWMDREEFLNMVAIAESTPGPIAINSATFVGFKMAKGLGSTICTLAVTLPSLIIITVLSVLINEFNLLEIEYVEYAFRGITACVVFLIIFAGVKLLFSLKKDFLSIFLFIISFVCLILFALFSISFSTVFYILIGGGISLSIFSFIYIRNKIKKGGKK